MDGSIFFLASMKGGMERVFLARCMSMGMERGGTVHLLGYAPRTASFLAPTSNSLTRNGTPGSPAAISHLCWTDIISSNVCLFVNRMHLGKCSSF